MNERQTLDLQCPKCGAVMEWHESEQLKVCSHCGYATKMLESEDLTKTKLVEKRKNAERMHHEETEEKERKTRNRIFVGLIIFLLIAVVIPYLITTYRSLF